MVCTCLQLNGRNAFEEKKIEIFEAFLYIFCCCCCNNNYTFLVSKKYSFVCCNEDDWKGQFLISWKTIFSIFFFPQNIFLCLQFSFMFKDNKNNAAYFGINSWKSLPITKTHFIQDREINIKKFLLLIVLQKQIICFHFQHYIEHTSNLVWLTLISRK